MLKLWLRTKARIASWMHYKALMQRVKDLSALRGSADAESPQILVSLTSYPARIAEVEVVIRSILCQDVQPDVIVLWLARSQFPGGEDALPKALLGLRAYGLKIEWCDDLRSYKKLIPAVERYPQAVIVTADDDAFYPRNWLRTLLESYRRFPDCVSCHRGSRVELDAAGIMAPYTSWKNAASDMGPSFLNFPTGVGGVLYPPGLLHETLNRREMFMALAPTTDDVWFWSMALLKGTRIVVADGNIPEFEEVNQYRQTYSNANALFYENCYGGKNDENLAKVVQALGLNLEDLRQQESREHGNRSVVGP